MAPGTHSMIESYHARIPVPSETGSRVAILGGGIAGLSAGYFLRLHSVPFTIYEAKPYVGGNCITFSCGEFRFDSGPHRLHTEDEGVTSLVKSLLGSSLHEVHSPNQVYYKGRFVDFPFSLFSFARDLGLAEFARAAYAYLRSRSSGGKSNDLRSFALSTYGKSIAERFLLNYSSKLWGVSPELLSATLASTRLKGLGVRSVLTEAGRRSGKDHREGKFYYPSGGIGKIVDVLAAHCGRSNIVLESRITEMHHNGSRITSIVANGKGIPVDGVISTLPLPHFIRMPCPPAPAEILESARHLVFRHVLLVGLLLKRPAVTSNATIYFPSREFIFTRIYEPRNRCPTMAPAGHTSLVAEIPFGGRAHSSLIKVIKTDGVFAPCDQRRVTERVISDLVKVGLLQCEDIADMVVVKMEDAYPVILTDTHARRALIHRYLDRFENLKLIGRGGTFRYTSIHHVLRDSRDAINALLGTETIGRVAEE